MSVILSIDVGIRHLAYCLVRSLDGGDFDVLEWNVVDVTGPGKHRLDDMVDMLLSQLDDRFFDAPRIDAVLIENQPANKNPIMKSVQMVIFTFFKMLQQYVGNVGAVVLVSASAKLTTKHAAPHGKPTSYAARKRASVEACKKYLSTPDKAAQMGALVASNKKDDMSDCFLQAMWWIEKKHLQK